MVVARDEVAMRVACSSSGSRGIRSWPKWATNSVPVVVAVAVVVVVVLDVKGNKNKLPRIWADQPNGNCMAGLTQ